MRTKVTLILVLLNVVLFYYIFYIRVIEGRDPDARDRVLGPETANIQSLTISDSSKTIHIENRGSQWWITQPLDWPANQFAVERIINELKLLKHKTSFAVADLGQNDQTLADFGLEKPPLTLTFTPASAGSGPQPEPVVLRIGDITPVGNNLYVLSPDGKRVHVVGRSLIESLTLRVEDLRADTLFTIGIYEVRSFNIQLSPVKVRLRTENNRWVFESPLNVRASKTATVLAINALNGLRAKSFLDAPNNSLTGLASPSLRITLEGNNRRETLLVGAAVDPASAASKPTTLPPALPGEIPSLPPVEHYAKMADKSPVFIVALPAELLTALRNAQEVLRDTHVLDVEASTVTAINLTGINQQELTLQRLEAAPANPATAAWQGVRRDPQSGPQSFPADREIVSRLLQKLNQLTATAFVTDVPSAAEKEDFGFNRPVRTITLSLTPGSSGPAAQLSSVTLQIGTSAGADPKTYAKLENQDYIYAVSPNILDDTPLAPLAYRERLLRELPAGAQITALKLTDLADNSVALEATLPFPDAPAATTPPAPERRAAVEALASQLRVLRAREFIRETLTPTVPVEGEERPWRYRLDITLTLVGGSGAQIQNSSLQFSERLGGSTLFVGSPEFGLVFTAEQPLLDAFFAVIHGPRDPGPAPATSAAETTPPAATPAAPLIPAPEPTHANPPAPAP